MKNIILILSMLTLTSCASTPKFSWTDKASRVMIDNTGIPVEQYAMIQDALIKSDHFVIIDRPDKARDIQKEVNKTDEDDVTTKYALWAKKYGIGGVVVAHVQCHTYKPFLRDTKLLCHQYLAVVSPLTGETLAHSESDNEGDTSISYSYLVPDWEVTTNQLVKVYSSAVVHNRLLELNNQKVLSTGPAPTQVEPTPAPQPVAQAPVVTVKPDPTPVVKAPEAPAVTTPKAPDPAPVASTPKAEAPKVDSTPPGKANTPAQAENASPVAKENAAPQSAVKNQGGSQI